MPVYDDRSKEPVHPYRPRPKNTGHDAETALPPAPLQRAEAKAPATPHGARLQREWLHLEIQRYRRQLEETREAPEGLAGRLEARRGRGTPLPDALHDRLEAHLGGPLPRIVIHADEEADALAGALGAEAFTAGQDIFFRQGAYDPESEAGQRLLAHEAAHVLQQARGLAGPGLDPDPALEAQARRAEQGFTPRPALRLGLAAGLEVELPADERRVLDEGSALALRGAYRAVAHRLAQAYRQGLGARETARAIREAEAATGMPLLEAVLTFLGRAEGLKAGLLRAYRGEEPQPAPAQASPAVQCKPLKPQEAAELAAAREQLQRVNRQMALEIAGVMADVAGIVDPTPISDGISAAISLARGDFVGTGLSLVSMLPYVGDAAAKSAKGARALQRLRGLVHQAEQAVGVIRRLDPAGVRQAEATLATLTEKVRNVLRYRSVRVTADHIRRLGDDVLDEMEKLGGHLLAKHVGKKDQELIQRAIREGVEAASTFPNKATATRAVLENIRSHADKIVEWLDNKVKLPDQPLRLEFEHSFEVGRSVQEGSKRVQGGLKKSVLILKKAPDKPLGFYILTGFPSAK